MRDITQYLGAIHGAYPELLVARAQVIEHGQNNVVLLLDDRLIFRFPRYAEGIAQLARETTILQAVGPHVPLAVPAPAYIHLADQPVGAAFVGYPAIAGEPFWRETFAAYQDASTLDTWVQQLGSFLRDLHAVPVEAMSAALPPQDTLAEWSDLYQRINAGLVPHMGLDAQRWTAQHFVPFLEQLAHAVPAPVLKHGDFGTSNILFDHATRRICGVIDFGGAGLGDPAYDLAGLLSSYGADFVWRLAGSYPGLHALWPRIAFYSGSFALLEALFGLEHGDPKAFANGMAAYR